MKNRKPYIPREMSGWDAIFISWCGHRTLAEKKVKDRALRIMKKLGRRFMDEHLASGRRKVESKR